MYAMVSAFSILFLLWVMFGFGEDTDSKKKSSGDDVAGGIGNLLLFFLSPILALGGLLFFLLRWMLGIFPMLLDALHGLWIIVRQMLGAVWSVLKKGVKLLQNLLSHGWKALKGFFKDVRTFGDFIGRLLRGMWEILTLPFKMLKKLWKVLTQSSKFIQKLSDRIKGFTKSMLGFLRPVMQAIRMTTRMIWDALQGVVHTLLTPLRLLNTLFDRIERWSPRFGRLLRLLMKPVLWILGVLGFMSKRIIQDDASGAPNSQTRERGFLQDAVSKNRLKNKNNDQVFYDHKGLNHKKEKTSKGKQSGSLWTALFTMLWNGWSMEQESEESTPHAHHARSQKHAKDVSHRATTMAQIEDDPKILEHMQEIGWNTRKKVYRHRRSFA